MTEACPICGGSPRSLPVHSRNLRIRRCRRCGHSLAEHLSPREQDGLDYHAQYDRTTFLDALSRTRRRQSHRIASLAARLLPGATRLVDFGSGRGFLLDAARSAGFEHLLGLDSSELAVQLLRERGFDADRVEASATVLPARALSLRPDVLSLLDVVEHFPPAELCLRLDALLAQLEPRLVIVKVPVSEGLLYRLARGAAWFGVSNPLEQLYQVGTEPPHRSYFSRRSLRLLLERLGLKLVHAEADRDFDATGFSQRVRSLARLGRAGDLLGAVAESASEQLGLEDSLIAFARPAHAAASPFSGVITLALH